MEHESSGFIDNERGCLVFSCPLAVIRNGGRSSGVLRSDNSLWVNFACSIVICSFSSSYFCRVAVALFSSIISENAEI